MFDIILDLDEEYQDDSVNIPQVEDFFNTIETYEQNLQPPIQMELVSSPPSSCSPGYFESSSSPLNLNPGPSGVNSQEIILQPPELVNGNGPYFYYDSNNIGYSFDPVTQSYIPVNVNIQQQNSLIGSNGVSLMPNLNGFNDPSSSSAYNYYGSYFTTDSNGMRNYYVDDENKRPKKRKRKSTIDLPTPEKLSSNVKMFEDSLLALDSQSFDEYVEGAYLVKKFSEDEKEYFRDIRRRIKNRESARKSRKNKRTKLDTLAYEVQELTDESSNLRQENLNLRQENFQLKNEVVYLQSVISNYNNSYESKKSIKPENSSSPMSTHSVILFVFLFSFGILWNLDSSIFNSSYNLLQNNKHQFISQSVKNNLVEDKVLNQLLDKIQNDARAGDMNYDGDPTFEKSPPKKDVEICCF